MRKPVSIRFPCLLLRQRSVLPGFAMVVITLLALAFLNRPVAFAQERQPAEDSPRGGLFPQTKDNVHLEMVINYLDIDGQTVGSTITLDAQTAEVMLAAP
jgi:hypothetical protein